MSLGAIEFKRANSQVRSQGNMGVVTLETQPGFWGTVLCGVVLAIVGFVGQRKRPQQAGGGLPSS